MRIEGILVRPALNDCEMAGAARLLKQLEPEITFILAAHVAILLEGSHGGRPRRRQHVHIGYGVDSGVRRRLRAKRSEGQEEEKHSSHALLLVVSVNPKHVTPDAVAGQWCPIR